MGAGWFATEDASGNIQRWDQIYFYKPTSGVTHDLYTTLSSGTNINAIVKQDTSSTSTTWTATTYSNSRTVTFGSGSTVGQAAGAIARANEAYTNLASDMPGVFDQLKYRYWSGSSQASDYFSFDINMYKCWDTNNSAYQSTSYRMDKLAEYSTGTPPQIDKVQFGPRPSTLTDECDPETTSWELWGE